MGVARKSDQPKLLMPKATAVWLIENTALTFRQIADFADLTTLEVEALANEDIGRGIVGRDPVQHGEVSAEEIRRCEADEDLMLKVAKSDLPQVKARSKGPRYTPVSKRGDKPDAIAYILKNVPDMRDAQICKLIGTTKPTISAVRDRTHPNAQNLRPRHPAELGLCTYVEYERATDKALRAAGKDPEAIKAQRQADLEAANTPPPPAPDKSAGMAGFDFSNFLKPTSTPALDDNDA